MVGSNIIVESSHVVWSKNSRTPLQHQGSSLFECWYREPMFILNTAFAQDQSSDMHVFCKICVAFEYTAVLLINIVRQSYHLVSGICCGRALCHGQVQSRHLQSCYHHEPGICRNINNVQVNTKQTNWLHNMSLLGYNRSHSGPCVRNCYARQFQ